MWRRVSSAPSQGSEPCRLPSVRAAIRMLGPSITGASVVVFLSMAALSILRWPANTLRWPANTHLFVLDILSFGAGAVGRMARRRLWRGWLPVHITGMPVSYSCYSPRSMWTTDHIFRSGVLCRRSRIGSVQVLWGFRFWSGRSGDIRRCEAPAHRNRHSAHTELTTLLASHPLPRGAGRGVGGADASQLPRTE
jgi:hypothetical protein